MLSPQQYSNIPNFLNDNDITVEGPLLISGSFPCFPTAVFRILPQLSQLWSHRDMTSLAWFSVRDSVSVHSYDQPNRCFWNSAFWEKPLPLAEMRDGGFHAGSPANSQAGEAAPGCSGLCLALSPGSFCCSPEANQKEHLCVCHAPPGIWCSSPNEPLSFGDYSLPASHSAYLVSLFPVFY